MRYSLPERAHRHPSCRARNFHQHRPAGSMPTPESVICILMVSAAASASTSASSLAGVLARTAGLASAALATIAIGPGPGAVLACAGAAALTLGDRPPLSTAGLLAIAGGCATLLL